jgi:Flp pilus assembly protein TadG
MGRSAELLRKLKGSQQGAALVLVALSIVALIGFTALAVDGGYLYFRHTRLQDISDAAAIAAGMELVEAANKNKREESAFYEAVNYAELHGLVASEVNKNDYSAKLQWGSEIGRMTVSFSDELSKVMVRINIEANTFYARALGTTSTPVGVTSVVQIGRASQQRGNLIPVALVWNPYYKNTKYDLSFAPGKGQQGNYGYLDFDDPSQFENYMKYGYNGTLQAGDEIDTYPGVSVGLVKQAIDDRIAACTKDCACQIVDADNINVDDSCPRIVIIPILQEGDFFQTEGNEGDHETGKHKVTIVAFARFFIQEYNPGQKILSGWFLDTVEPSEIIEGDDQFTTQSVNLIR